MIEIRDLAFAYPAGGFQLRIPAFDLAEGERLAVVGPSGSGKTTLLDLISGIRLPSAGSLRVEGEEVSRMSDAARRAFRLRRIGFVFQDFELLDYLTIQENILYPYRISNALKLDAATRARARALAEAAGIGKQFGRHPNALSRGERQRAAICRSLITAPRLVLADEATGALDPDNKLRVLDLLFERVAAEGAALLAVTHDTELLQRFDRVVDFRDYRIGAEP
jgi:putative ABC transport system ATP-binding protein